ncbi:MAG TPA: peptidylprolyl isomerase [Verrucomicrobiae bacterium]|jgi:hypothetical protein|nr:peptidylprolyl isomerase [Verrucomicrobiae bacterium]
MLDILRKNTKSIIWVVVGSFVLWGAFSVGSQFSKKGRYAGQVFGKSVSFQEFNSFFQAAQTFSYSEDRSQDPEVLRHKAWQNLIYSREAKREHISVSDDEVRQELQQLLAVHGLQNPTPQMYRRWLKATLRLEPRQFESQLREMIRVQKLVSRVMQQPVKEPSEQDLHDLYLMDEQHLTGEAVLFNTLEEAQTFQSQAVDETGWQKVVKDHSYVVVPAKNLPLTELNRLWQIPKENVLALFALPKGSVSDPLPVEGKYAVFLVQDKVAVDPSALTPEKQAETKEKALKILKKQVFFAWHLNLMQRAKLRDFAHDETE